MIDDVLPVPQLAAAAGAFAEVQHGSLQECLSLAAHQCLENMAQAIVRESLGSRVGVEQLLRDEGVRLVAQPYGRWSTLTPWERKDSAVSSGPVCRLLKGLVSLVARGDPRPLAVDVQHGIEQHALSLLAPRGSTSGDAWRGGHNLYPIPVHRPDWQAREAYDFAPGCTIQIPFVSGTPTRGNRNLGHRIDEWPIHPLAARRQPELAQLVEKSCHREERGTILTSIRTVRLPKRELKLPIKTWITSASRRIPIDYFLTSRLMSQIAAQILDAEQPRDWTIQVDSKSVFAADGESAPTLGYIERPRLTRRSGSAVLIAAEFFGDSEVLQHSLAHYRETRRFLDRYVQCAVWPWLLIASRYGVFIEPHLQNVCLEVSESGEIRRGIVRDLDNIYLYPNWATDALTSVPAEVCDLQRAPLEDCVASFQHSLRDAHVSQLVIALASVSGTSSEEIRDLLVQRLAAVAQSCARSNREAAFAAGALQEGGGVKRLLSMHLRRSTTMLFDDGLGSTILRLLN